MTYRDVIVALLERAEKEDPEFTLTKYAAKVHVTQPHLSKIKSGKQKGTWKQMEHCLTEAGIDISECIVLPFDPKTKTEDEAALRTLREGIARGGVTRKYVLHAAEFLRDKETSDSLQGQPELKKAVNQRGTKNTALK